MSFINFFPEERSTEVERWCVEVERCDSDRLRSIDDLKSQFAALQGFTQEFFASQVLVGKLEKYLELASHEEPRGVTSLHVYQEQVARKAELKQYLEQASPKQPLSKKTLHAYKEEAAQKDAQREVARTRVETAIHRLEKADAQLAAARSQLVAVRSRGGTSLVLDTSQQRYLTLNR